MVRTCCLTPEAIEALRQYEHKIKGRKEYRRWQSVWLTEVEGKTAHETAFLLRIHWRTVQKHQRRYRIEGLATFDYHSNGVKGSRLLTPEQEAEVFTELKAEASEGQLLKARQIKTFYEEKLGKPCSVGTIYNGLKRQGWSKKQPRPRHPKGCEEEKDLFKKTF